MLSLGVQAVQREGVAYHGRTSITVEQIVVGCTVFILKSKIIKRSIYTHTHTCKMKLMRRNKFQESHRDNIVEKAKKT